MNYREGSEKDLPAIIDLLKASLGEKSIPKSEQLWKWKHWENPFGKSPLIVAEEDEKIIGLRTFLRWEFIHQKKIIKAFRAIDTAVHPAYQGNGIFKSITLALIDQLKSEDVDLIYNTPNSKSLPGYLSMGWEKYGKLPIKLQFTFNHTNKPGKEPCNDWGKVAGLILKIESDQDSLKSVRTRLVRGYITWRYISCPLFPYYYISDGCTYLLVYRIIERKMGRELRIADLFILPDFGNIGSGQLNKELSIVQEETSTKVITFSGLDYPLQKAIRMGALPIVSIGPIVTLKQLKDSFYLQHLPWGWSLGDLEVL